ncbi:MAG: hypothetical protein JZU52_07860 [Lamprocystis purpurea]|jgi:hypothetical protein|uniref:hypothetical protein n=1 Tax=Lamprocystis purpurea TaxID=61598 RepID=UPI00035E1104|nr:hypothetical protein [Lamprocystis purpurea]MBV5273547.1 hypothetical protein [Lamprocystis purpurea]
MTVDQIEDAVTRLPPNALEQFAQWFEEYLSNQLDKQIEADSLAGKFDAAAKRADDDFQAGRCTPL